MKAKYNHLLIFFIPFFCLNAMAQVWPGPHPLLSSHIKINAEAHIASQVDTFDSKFGYEKAEVEFGLPLYRGKDWLTPTGNTPLIGVTLQGAASYMLPEGSFINNDIELLRTRLGSNFIYSRGTRNLYMLNVQGIIAGDRISLSDIYVNGSAFWRHRQNDQFGWTLGLAYTSLFAKSRVYPLVGVSLRPSKENLINILLPAYVQYVHFFNRASSVLVSLKPNGGFYHDDITEDAITNRIVFRHRSILLSAALNLKLSYALSIAPEAGWAGRTRLTVNDFKYKTSPSVFFKITLRYKFGQRANVAPILDFDPADFSTSDPEIPEN